MNLVVSSLLSGMNSISTMTCRTVYSCSYPILTRLASRSVSDLPSVSQMRTIHYPASSPKSEKPRQEFPVRTWRHDRFKLENAYHRKKMYGPDRRLYTKNGLKIIWRKILKGRHVLHH